MSVGSISRRLLFSPHSQSQPLTAIQSHRAVLYLYRKIVRIMPRVLTAYQIEGEGIEAEAIGNVRKLFESSRNVSNIDIIEVLRLKAELEIQETLLLYKTKSHVYNMLFKQPMLAETVNNKAPAAIKQKLLNNTRTSSKSPEESQFLIDFLRGTA